ncbi:MAG: PTS transporter subunit EIIC [Candidatus Niameybacter stercoravium]|nr:PTS transporter subunit EIIC [Candidatus Niameybacter stercoravium]
MDHKKVAQLILQELGGQENLVSAAHCATRLRLVIASNEKVNKAELENIEGVKGVFFASGQLQLIIGTGTVNKVYSELLALTGGEEVSKDELKKAADANTNKFKKLIKTLGDIFVPIIPAIVSGGLMMGLTEAITFCVNNGFIDINTQGSIFVFLKLFSNAAYVFLPILIGFSAAKVFGGNRYLGAVIAMIMIHPDLQNAWTVSAEGYHAMQSVWGGLYEIPLIGYQGHVIPIVISVWIMSRLEIKLHKIVPEMFDLFITPLVTIFVTGYLTLTLVGPVFVFIENAVLTGVQQLIQLPFGIGGFLMGGIYASTVVTGVHHMYSIIDLGQISQYGYTYWLPIASAANVAQGGAALAVAVKTKNKKLKSLAFPAAVSSMLGITEPAIFGVNLRYFRPFIAASIGAACGALYASVVGLGATGTGVTGVFGILLHLHAPLQYIILFAISLGVAFVMTLVLGWKEENN